MYPSHDDQDKPQPSSISEDETSASAHFAQGFAPATAREEQLLRAQAQSHDAYIASIAHDLKNPLTTIMGRVELMKRLLQRAEITPADLQRHLTPLEAAVNRLNGLLEAISQSNNASLGQREKSR